MAEQQESADTSIDELCEIKKNYVDKTYLMVSRLCDLATGRLSTGWSHDHRIESEYPISCSGGRKMADNWGAYGITSYCYSICTQRLLRLAEDMGKTNHHEADA